MVDWDGFVAGWAARDGGYDLRRAPAPVRGWLRFGYETARGLAAARVGPAAVTALGLVLSAAVPLVAGRGATGLVLAAGLVLLASLAGTLDRALDLLTRSDGGSPRSAIWRVAAARAGEVGWLAGFWIAGVPGPLVAACGALTGLHELVREQALATGASRLGAQTVVEGPTRASVAVAGLALAGLAALGGGSFAPGVLTVSMVVWLLLALVGFGQLSAVVQKSLP
ncbi:MAG: CDP-alcohol phosphatidyltransferase family protein [Micromonosporaceae bacterium]|nr:CDP-alcohol phosphatidyltransferase family protein [Micromonosporaceae bacterium]